MKLVESIARIILVTGVFIVWLGMAFLPTLAKATEVVKPKPKPPVVTTAPTPQPDTDRHSANLLLGAAGSGLLTAAFRQQEYGALKAFGVTVAGAAAIEAAHDGGFNHSNLWYAVGGAAVGAIGVCNLYFRKGFVGCAVPFK